MQLKTKLMMLMTWITVKPEVEDPEIDELIHDPEALQEEAAPAEEMIPEETEPDPGPPARDWIGIYSSFILDGGYWNSGED